MSCSWMAIGYLLALTLMIFAFFFRSLVALLIAQQSTLAARVITSLERDDVSTVSSKHTPMPPLTRAFYNRLCARLKWIFDAIIQVDGEQSVMNNLVASRQVLGIGSQQALFAMVFTPALVGLGLMVGLVPAYSEGCSGCEFYYELFITLNVIIVLYCGLVARVLWKFYWSSTTDEFGLKREMTLLFVTPPLPAIAAWVLIITDAGELSYNFVFPYEWFLVIAMLSTWFIMIPLQIGWAVLEHWKIGHNLNEARKLNIKVGMTSLEFSRQLLNEHLFDDRLMEVCQRRFMVESLKFAQTVTQWRQLYYERSQDWRRIKALTVYNMFLKDEAILQINVGDELVAEVKHNMESGDVLLTLFDNVMNEIAILLATNGAFVQFANPKKQSIVAPYSV